MITPVKVNVKDFNNVYFLSHTVYANCKYLTNFSVYYNINRMCLIFLPFTYNYQKKGQVYV